MEARQLAPEAPPPPTLRLLEGRRAAPEWTFSSLRAWVVLFGSLSFAGGHGVFLFTALTRLEKIPGETELGSGFELVVLGWFLAAGPLAFLSALLRRRFFSLGNGAAWSLASFALVCTLVAFVFYLRAIALA
jgi:hypothetical protein